MKKIIGLWLVLMLALTACGKTEMPSDVNTEQVCVGIKVGESGYYSTMADVELHYYNGKLTDIKVIDPTLLAFQVSEKWDGGAYIYSYEEISEIIDSLKQYDDPELEELIKALQQGLLMTQEST